MTRRPPQEALDFLPAAAALAHRPLPLACRAALYLMLLLLAAAVAWVGLCRTDRVVRARGRLVTVSRPMTVQPAQTGVIRALDVRIGDVVAAGQRLAVLDPTFTQADLGQLRDRLDYLTAWAGRLEAELAGAAPALPVSADEALSGQIRLLRERRAQFAARMEAFDQEAEALRRRLDSNRREQVRLAERAAMVAEMAGMHRRLYDEQAASRMEYLKAEEEARRLAGDLARVREEEPQLARSLAKAAADREAFAATWRSEAADMLTRARQEAGELRHQLAKAERLHELEELRAPAAGVVKSVAECSVGSVVRPAEPLVVLTPLDGDLELALEVRARDIGRVRAGQAVRVKFDAFPFQRHGARQGVIEAVSPDAFVREGAADEGEGQNVIYRARAGLAPGRLRGVPEDFRLLPGMTLTAEVKVGVRRLSDYVLDPFLRALDESFTEPD